MNIDFPFLNAHRREVEMDTLRKLHFLVSVSNNKSSQSVRFLWLSPYRHIIATWFALELQVPTAYPYEKPLLFVDNPRILRKWCDERSINDLGASHDFHTYSNGPNGQVQICYTDEWTPTMTWALCLKRGIVWLEAYCWHLWTGKTIAELIEIAVKNLEARNG